MKPVSDIDKLRSQLESRFGDLSSRCEVITGQIVLEIPLGHLIEVATILRDENGFEFEQLIDLSGVDFSTYGEVEWETVEATSHGFSRGVSVRDSLESNPDKRFAVVYQLLSLVNNQRLRLRVFAEGDPPIVPSVTGIWRSANWYEREAFDLFGILFDGHPDLRRILTDYGFIGHPFRKDFPLEGNVEVRYDEEKGRVVYEPVSIENRVLVPRVIRNDSRYVKEDS